MLVDFTNKEIKVLKLIIDNANVCSSGCIWEESEDDPNINCDESCEFYRVKYDIWNKICDEDEKM